MGQVAGTLRSSLLPTHRIWIMHSIALLGWFGAALSIALPWPQVWRSVARGRTKGLSATACWQGVAMPVGWITYGLLTGETVQVVTNTVTGVAGLAVLVTVLLKQGELRTGRTLLISATGAAGVLTAAGGSAAAGLLTGIGCARAAAFLGAVLAFTAILGAIPQPLSLLRDRGQDLAGLSPLRWWLAAAACSSWCAYGLATGQIAVWLSALVGLGSALIVCWVLVTDRRTRATAGTVTAAAPVRVTHGTTRVVRPAQVPHLSRVTVPVTADVVRPHRTAVPHSSRVIVPATAGVARAHRTAVPAAARVARPASAAAWPVYGAARPVDGAARIVRPAGPRQARGVARVPRPSDTATATMVMVRELALA